MRKRKRPPSKLLGGCLCPSAAVVAARWASCNRELQVSRSHRGARRRSAGDRRAAGAGRCRDEVEGRPCGCRCGRINQVVVGHPAPVMRSLVHVVYLLAVACDVEERNIVELVGFRICSERREVNNITLIAHSPFLSSRGYTPAKRIPGGRYPSGGWRNCQIRGLSARAELTARLVSTACLLHAYFCAHYKHGSYQAQASSNIKIPRDRSPEGKFVANENKERKTDLFFRGLLCIFPKE